MIVTYNDDYKALFAQAEENLELAENTIQNLATFYSYLPQLIVRDSKYLHIPLDEGYFHINANTRKISTPSGMSILGVEGDHLAEIIFFSVDRFYDTQDLSVCFRRQIENPKNGIYINWITANKSNYVTRAIAEYWDNEHVYFGCAISKELTEQSGVLTFAVSFRIYDTDPSRLNNCQFELNTAPVTFSIAKGIGFNSAVGAPQEIDDYSDLIFTRPTYSGIMNSSDGSKPIILLNLLGTVDLDPDADDTATLVVNVLPAMSDDVITVQWYRNGEAIPGADDDTLRDSENGSYKITEYVADEVGEYRVAIGNSHDGGTTFAYDYSRTCLIPYAADVENVGINSNYITSNGANQCIVTHKEVPAGNTTIYTWAIDPTAPANVSNLASGAVLTPTAGTYCDCYCNIQNIRNKNESGIERTETVKIRPAAAALEDFGNRYVLTLNSDSSAYVCKLANTATPNIVEDELEYYWAIGYSDANNNLASLNPYNAWTSINNVPISLLSDSRFNVVTELTCYVRQNRISSTGSSLSMYPANGTFDANQKLTISSPIIANPEN